jgi:Ni/Co efflux regulator RcnB
MKSKAFVLTVIALSLTTGSLALAQGSNGGRHDRNDRYERNDRRDDARQHDRRNFGRNHNEEMRRGRGAGPGHQYYRGDRLPAEYRNRHYVVNDWRSHNLSAPPRGHQWVQSGNDYVMIAIATGIIAQLLLGQ